MLSPQCFLKFDQFQPSKFVKSFLILLILNFKILSPPLGQIHPDGLCDECVIPPLERLKDLKLKEETVPFILQVDGGGGRDLGV